MPKIKLTDRYVDGLSPPQQDRLEISDTVRLGLRLRVAPTGRKVWLYEKRVKGGVKRKHTLGPYPQVRVSDARKLAAELELEAMRGIDRIEETRRSKDKEEAARLSRASVRDVLDSYEQLHLSTLRTADERKRMLNKALAPFVNLSIRELTRVHLQTIIDDKAKQGTMVYANRYKAALSHFAKFAWTRGYTERHIGEGLTGAGRERPRDRVLTLKEVKKIWAKSFEEKGQFGAILRLLILTGQRRSDIAKLRWSEVNFINRRLELSGERQKNAKAHITHLSDPALEELQNLRRIAESDSGYVFTTTGLLPVSGFSRMKRRLDKRLGPNSEHWRLHDLRTAFATVMAEAGEPETLVDRILNHSASGSAPSAVARVYNQSSQLPQRARILDRWAALVTQPLGEVLSLTVRATG